MAKVAILLADGFETIEALAPADVLRRAGEDVSLVTINALPHVTTAHGIGIDCDTTLDEYDFGACDLIVLPGGMPGTTNLRANERVCELTRQFMSEKRLGAICAAPSILAELGLLDARVATCYPGCEVQMGSAKCVPQDVARDGKVITGRAAGAALDFGLALLSALRGEEAAKEIADAIVYRR